MKIKKVKCMELVQAIKRIIATGKMEIGTNKTIDSIREGKAKAVIIAENTPRDIKQDIVQYAKLEEIPVVVFNNTSLILGEICGKPFVITAIAVTNPGDIKIKQLTEATQ